MPSSEYAELEKLLSESGQEHLVRFWPRLREEQRAALARDVRGLELAAVRDAFEECQRELQSCQKLDELLQPIPEELHEGLTRCSPDQLQAYREEGLRQISEGRVAALLLAGGQGTRLGVKYPKGMYDVGLPSRKTLYQLQGERLLKLQELAAQQTGTYTSIPWYIMTSEHTMDATVEFFAKHRYFGLKEEDLVVFEQFMLPCLTFDGKIILESTHKISKAPDGNGGLFRALKNRGILEDMVRRGVRYVHVYCVDNILVKMADPIFIGYCVQKEADCAAKVVEKVSPSEAVGVVCRVDGKFQVVEYSEISAETARRRNADGRLVFNAGNICNHFFTVDFLHRVGSGQKLRRHIAKKKIPHVDEDGQTITPTAVNGIKLEQFVFDVFEFSNKFVAWEVLREDEFSPLKNADADAATCTPSTAREALYALHRRYVRQAGGAFAQESHTEDVNGNLNGDDQKTQKYLDGARSGGVCEISPLVSYDGEGLEDIVRGKLFTFPLSLVSSKEQSRIYAEPDLILQE